MERLCRWLACAALAAAAAAQENPDPKDATQELKGPAGRIVITVPASWRSHPPSGSIILRAIARGAYGGHDLIIVREEGQADVDKQRDRYMEYDGGKYGGGEFKKIAEPFFGYRLNVPDQNRVMVRAFVTDGNDGLVLSVSSRLQFYDKYWAKKVVDVLASLKIGAGGAVTEHPEQAGEKRRVFDRTGQVSVVAPGVWKSLETETEEELLFLGLKGTSKGPTIRIVDRGGPTNASLVLLKIAGQWRKAYGGISLKRVGTNPPALMAKNRKEGWVDYLIAFAAGNQGYTLSLSVREGSFERFKALADEMAGTVVFMSGAYAPPAELPGDLTVEHRKTAVLHLPAEQVSAADKIAQQLSTFQRQWRRIAVGKAVKAPLHIVITDADSFPELSHGFGETPAAYDRLICAVVTLPPPSLKENVPLWRGRLYAALAEASMHRDLKVAPPAWLLAGLAACIEAAGRTGKGPDQANPGLVKLLDLKTSTDSHMPLKQVLRLTYADMAADPKNLTMAWGYTHLMNFGGGTLASTYKKWTKALAKAKTGVPKFDLKKYDRAEEDLKRHVFKHWGK
ncbi:MAG: hypothetical protein ACYSUM_15295 [Planctomycetota bacterium]|jgi:hypothetical protein